MSDATSAEKPLPPEDISIYASVDRRWKLILDSWKNGWHLESAVESLDTTIEYYRKQIFEDRSVDAIYDWEKDWSRAVRLHDSNSDFVRNRRVFNEDLKRMWSEWYERSATSLNALSLEALRGMILVNGATIIAALALLSGQIEKPNPNAVIAAKVMVFCSILSLIMMAAGHLMMFVRANDTANKVRGVLVGHMRHRKLYAISRYLRRFMDPQLKIGSALVYGSIFVFALSAFVSAAVLVFGSAPAS